MDTYCYISSNLKQLPYGGNKANYLMIAKKLGVRIPETVVVNYPYKWLKNIDAEMCKISMLKYIKELFNKIDEFMVRSSFYKEDSKETSFAGKFQSIHINSCEQIPEAIQSVWDSAGENWMYMGVIIQPYIQAHYSGVLFSDYNSTGNNLIEFTQGPCSDLVEGNLSPDVYTNNRGWINGKPSYINDTIINELNTVVCKLKEALESEVDIEFCVDYNAVLYILQCRPITFKKKKRLANISKEFKGEWQLHGEMPYPFTPLVLSLDPTGLFNKRTNKVLNNYIYFKKNDVFLPSNNTNDDNWKNWEKIQDQYTKIFQSILGQKASLELLEKAILNYRNLVDIYMNINWFRYRKQVYRKLIEKLKMKDQEYYHITFAKIIRTVNTINFYKRADFSNLIKHYKSEKFPELRNEFVQKYGFETAHPFYIYCKSLGDYLDDIIILAREKKKEILFKEMASNEPEEQFDDCELNELISEYKNIVKRTEDDDYLLCMGAYTIRSILNTIEQTLPLGKDQIFFLQYSELKEIVQNNIVVSYSEIERRRQEYELSKNYEMPTRIVDGKGLYFKNSFGVDTLDGVIISPGKATGRIHILKNASDIFEIISIPNGSIIYSSCISPILSSYFFNIKGIILSETSVLGHGAIMAREMRIPAVGGINFNFNENSIVEIDGDNGKVKIIK